MGSTRPGTMRSGTRRPGPGHDAITNVSTRRSTTRPPTKSTQNRDNNTRQQPETNHQPLPEKPTSLQIRILLLRSTRIVRSVRAPLRTSGPRTGFGPSTNRVSKSFGSTSSRSMRRGSAWGVNRPDIQYTRTDGVRVCEEVDTSSSTRGPGHADRILANDPDAEVYLWSNVD